MYPTSSDEGSIHVVLTRLQRVLQKGELIVPGCGVANK
jgi:hypothetical protein